MGILLGFVSLLYLANLLQLFILNALKEVRILEFSSEVQVIDTIGGEF
jgi:hypothetical protein